MNGGTTLRNDDARLYTAAVVARRGHDDDHGDGGRSLSHGCAGLQGAEYTGRQLGSRKKMDLGPHG